MESKILGPVTVQAAWVWIHRLLYTVSNSCPSLLPIPSLQLVVLVYIQFSSIKTIDRTKTILISNRLIKYSQSQFNLTKGYINLLFVIYAHNIEQYYKECSCLLNANKYKKNVFMLWLSRVIIPSSQRRVYHFIRQTMQHWPLDSSFKQILEIWLSYIQPWRYLDFRTRCVFKSLLIVLILVVL